MDSQFNLLKYDIEYELNEKYLNIFVKIFFSRVGVLMNGFGCKTSGNVIVCIVFSCFHHTCLWVWYLWDIWALMRLKIPHSRTHMHTRYHTHTPTCTHDTTLTHTHAHTIPHSRTHMNTQNFYIYLAIFYSLKKSPSATSANEIKEKRNIEQKMNKNWRIINVT